MTAPATQIKSTQTVDTPEGQPEAKVTITADLLRESISSASNGQWLMAFTQAVRALPLTIDDAMQKYGVRIYEDMLLDPQIASVLDLLRLGATRDGIRLSVPENLPETDKAFAEEILALCQHVVDNLETPIKDVLYALTEALAFGHKIGEHVAELRAIGPGDREWIVFTDIRPKPASAVSIVVDDKYRTLGYLPITPGRLTIGMQTFTPNERGAIEIEGLLPPEKCINFVNKPKDGDPRGRSALRVLYTIWWMSQQMYPEWLAFLMTQAVPSYVGILPEGAQTWKDADGNEIEPRMALLEALQNIRNGGVAAVPNGSDIKVLQVLSKGEVFVNFFTWKDRQITKAITGQVLATEEAEHDTRAASTTHQDILSMPIDRVTEALCSAFRNQTLKVLVRLNYGEEAVRLTPHVHAATVEQQDIGTYSSAIAALVNAGVIPKRMFPQIWAELKLDGPSEEEWERMLQEESAQAAQVQQTPPPGRGGGGNGEQGEEEDVEERQDG